MKRILIGFFVILVISGCVEESKKEQSIDLINYNPIKCPEGYIHYEGNKCCLDKNNNLICDLEENIETNDEKCIDECSTDLCEGMKYVSCEMQSDGCMDKVVKDKVIGKCGVECLKESDCGSDEDCNRYVCEEEDEDCDDDCSKDYCNGFNFIECEREDGCKEEKYRGKVIGECGVECINNDDCSNNEECKSYKCVDESCKDTSWSPSASDMCSGESFTQTSNCGNTRQPQGTKDCSHSIEQTFSKTTVGFGEQMTITYHQPEGESYGIIQDIPSGWSASDLSPDGKYRAYVDSGDDLSIVVTAPSYSTTSSFIGKYFVYPDTDYTSFDPIGVVVS